MMIRYNKKRKAFTMAEILLAMAICALLSTAIYQVMRTMQKSYTFTSNKLDILQATRIIMSGIRNELRNAFDKPQVFNDQLNIPVAEDKVIVYYFDETEKRLYRGEKEKIDDPAPDKSEMRKFLFNDGQILTFEYDSSYRDSNTFVESEMALNAKVWFKVSMKVLYSVKSEQLSEEEKAKILASLNSEEPDSRVKSFSMSISPRKINWQLQSTQ